MGHKFWNTHSDDCTTNWPITQWTGLHLETERLALPTCEPVPAKDTMFVE